MLNSANDRLLPWCLRVWKLSFPIGAGLGVLSAARDWAISMDSPEPVPFWYWLTGHLAAFFFWSFFAPTVLLIMKRFPILKKTWPRNSLIHGVVYSSLAALYTVEIWGVDKIIAPAITQDLRVPFLHTFSVAVPSAIIKYYGPILVAGYLAVYYARLREEEFRTMKLSSQLAQAQLKALKMQLQPHFLFNTLHSISTLVYTDAGRADRMIVQLSDLLRMTLDDASSDLVPLEREIECARKYLAIEQTRFSDRLTVEFDVDPEALDVPVPYLLLQPIVENSVRHGTSKMIESGRISVSARLVHGRLQLRVSDNGPGFDAPEPARREGLGLKNTRERLEQIYQSNFQLRTSGSGGATVEISLPQGILIHDPARASANATVAQEAGTL
jgi:two-component system LytT family sensor kinase